MPKKKPSFYAVARGREPGVYLTWAEAEKQVKGFPGSVHRAFNTKAEADKYVAQCRNDAKQEPRSDQDAQLSDRFENMAIDPSQRLQCLHDHPLVAFCAGSAPSNGSGTAAYGVSFPLEEGFIRSAQVEDPQTNYHADCVAAQEVVRIANELDPKKERALVIYSRCLDLVSAMEYPRWIDKWQQNGWTTSANEAVSYQDIFRTLLEAETLRTIMWIFVDEKKSLRCLVELHLQAYHEAERVARAAAAAATGG